MSRKKKIILYVLAGILALWLVGPLLWVVHVSFQLDNEIFSRPPHWIPENPTLDNYRYILTGRTPPSYESTGASVSGQRVSGEALSALPAIRNSMIVATIVTLANLSISVMAAYTFSRLRFPGRGISFGFIMFSRLIPPIAVAIPFYTIIARLGLLDTCLALILVYLAFTLPFTIWFLTKYFDYIPPEVEEAAVVDGCNRFQSLTLVVMPMAAPGLAATAAFAFMAAYSEFLFAVFLTKTMASKTVPVVLSAAAINFDVSYALASTAVVLAVLPPIAFALVFRRYIIRGLSTAFGR